MFSTIIVDDKNNISMQVRQLQLVFRPDVRVAQPWPFGRLLSREVSSRGWGAGASNLDLDSQSALTTPILFLQLCQLQSLDSGRDKLPSLLICPLFNRERKCGSTCAPQILHCLNLLSGWQISCFD
jgi:hypothetical protein